MDFTELKSKVNIYSVASEMGFGGTRHGSCWQGECPKHGSNSGNCFTIWSGTQSFKCFHCGESGDVINLVMLYRGFEFTNAVNYIAEKAGMPSLEFSHMSEKERKEKENELSEKRLVEDMLTAAAGWYHKQLNNYPEIYQYLRDHYGFSDEIIRELQIGFAPVPQHTDNYSKLTEYLNLIDAFKGKLALSGLLSFCDPSGPFYDFFKGRIIFPYWKYGKVVYMAARATDHTQVNEYECYTRKEEKSHVA